MSRASAVGPRRPRGHHPGASRAGRRGFTIVEVVVALVILSVGVLALAGSSAVVMRQMTTGARTGQAASLAQSRFEQFASRASCNAIVAVGGSTGGTATSRGIEEGWRVTRPTSSGTVTVRDSVRVPRAKKYVIFESEIRCE
jgi:prepilin-type N-terminal cleavage/methylation domain-containing protein